MSNSNTQNDFSKGSIVKNIMNLAIPMTLAQLYQCPVQHRRPHLYRAHSRSRHSIFDRHRAFAANHHARHRICQPVWHGRCAALLDRTRARGYQRSRGNHGKFLLHDGYFRCASDRALPDIPQTNAVSVRRQRRYLSICGCLHYDLSARQPVRDGRAWHELIHQFTGLPGASA